MAAKNYAYQGHEVIFDHPEGELKYFDVDLEYMRVYQSSQNIVTSQEKFSVPFIFCEDGKVFVRNLFSFCNGYEGRCPLWIEGKLEDNNILLPLDSMYSFCFLYAFDQEYGYDFFEDSPVAWLVYSKINQEDFSINKIDDIGNVILKGTENGYKIEFPENECIYIDSNNICITRFECNLSETDFVIPPSGYKVEDYQINFKPYSNFLYTDHEVSLRLKAVKTENEIYLQGMSYAPTGNPEMWIKGEIRGDKVIFKNGTPIGVGLNRDTKYLTPVISGKTSTRVDLISHTILFKATKNDLIMDYDSETGRLSNPNFELAFTSEPNQTWEFCYGTELDYTDFIPKDYFIDMEFIKIPEDIVFEPKILKTKKEKDWTGEDIKYAIVDYLDENGYMMDPDKMYIQFYLNNSPVTIGYFDLRTWKYENSDLFPWGYSYFKRKFDFEFTGLRYLNSPIMKSISSDWDTAVLYYLEEGEVPEVPPTLGINEIENDFNNSLNNQKSGIFDLYGRRYDSIDNLSPGIYIINGKKTIINR
ncbi:MAG: hypothetical protein J1E82_08590 [Muribaculaceae bacterium]|nr:hypothetical protein [Muribaculaceae bacterium]